jgi:hypothetical protein
VFVCVEAPTELRNFPPCSLLNNAPLKKQSPNNQSINNEPTNPMKVPTILSLASVAAAIFLSTPVADARTWTSSDGSKTFSGELRTYDPGTGAVGVTLTNGKKMTFKQDKLSEEDIAYLKKNGAKTSGSSARIKKSIPEVLPDPDPAAAGPDKKKPIKVYFLSGQSNMCGEGRPATLLPLATSDEKFGYLVDDAGKWHTRNDVHHIYYVMDKQTYNGPLNVGGRFGPELGIGHILGYYHDEQVLLIKGACGNRSLGFDFLPPSSRKRLGKPMTADKGWYGGISYDRYVKSAKNVLENLDQFVPGYDGQGYEMAGFFWWQGHKDKGMKKSEYQELLGELINDFRTDFEAPEKTPFVVATVAFGGKNLGPWEGVFKAQMAISKDAEFKGNVGSVDIRDIGGGGAHYGNNGATYLKVGDRMGRAMAKLLNGEE